MTNLGNGGKYFAKAIKTVSKEIVERLSDDSLSSQDFKEILNSTVLEMQKELVNKEDGNTELTFSAYNMVLMCMAHYVIMESNVYDKYKKIPDNVLEDRNNVLSYFNNVVQTKLQEGRATKNSTKIEKNAKIIKGFKKEVSKNSKHTA